ncbi:hypothetical protein D9M72_540930 [compost metagenome]
MNDRDSGSTLEFLHRQMRYGSVPGGGIGQSVGIRLCVGDQILNVFDRKVRVANQHERKVAHQADRLEVFQGIVADTPVQVRIGANRRHVRQHHHTAVRRRTRQLRQRNAAALPRPVLHNVA